MSWSLRSLPAHSRSDLPPVGSGSVTSDIDSPAPFDPATWTALDTRAVDTARVLTADAVQKVGSGHPGTAMSLAPAAYLIFQHFLRHDPSDATWLGRDRFVLSCGHSSLTLYIQLYFSGYGLELSDLQALRTWGSLTPGHPEYRHTVGVETTTGPLGQGLATAVGMAMGQRYERGLLDPDATPDSSPFDHRVWVLASDGDLEEGLTAEASSLAGTQQLGNLIVVWDDNKISIEGDTAVAFNEDVLARYSAYGWHVESVDVLADGSADVLALAAALDAARSETSRPSLIRLETVIGWPAPTLRNTGKAHGAALGASEVAGTKEILGFDPEKTFEVADDVIAHARGVKDRGALIRARWDVRYEAWRTTQPDRAALLDRLVAGVLPDGLVLPEFPAGKDIATRKASSEVIQAVAAALPEFVGGSADLAESNNTTIEGAPSFLPVGTVVAESSPFGKNQSPYGRILHFGVREHAMGSALTGMSLSGLLRPFGGTFMVFSDYMRGAVRVAAIMQCNVTYVWTHDSIGVGEDGPTHQPVEHLWALRAIPGLAVVRPADANETSVVWREILSRRQPVGLALTRQNLPTFDRTVVAPASGAARGAYVLAEASNGSPSVILLATGSEVQIALAARELLESEGVAARVVSMPCLEWFEEQDAEYREAVLPSLVRARVSVEAGIAQGWWKYLGTDGRAVSLEHYGASADGATLFREFGFTPAAVVSAARESLAASAR
ncbi:MAG: transketolase [Actinobacteria bacterium]|nr:transketolase [Actinomycetota bacterium]MSW36144.1 transketolase [Actinomycetota bacterium]MSX38274.1 transketolase [Actinomycetota bacterium]